MIYWTVEPALISGAELEYPKKLDHEVKKFDRVLVLCDQPGKKYSLAIKINSVKINNSIDTPIIKLDKNNLGSLNAGDKVFIKEFNPPFAKQVLLCLDSKLDSKYIITEGNWGNEIVNPAVLNQVLDAGQSIEFVYGNDKPIILTGYIKASVPRTPVLIDSRTKFFIEKLSSDVIAKLKIESEEYNVTRAQEFIKLIKDEQFDALLTIRNKSNTKVEKTFNFSQIEPESVYKTLKNWFESASYKIFIDNLEKIKDNSIGTLIAFPKTKKDEEPDYILEINLSATLKQGTCLLIGYSENTNQIETQLSDLAKILKKLTTSLKEIPQAIPDICGGCGGRLNLTKQNNKGIVICDSCSSPNLLPVSLRV